MNLKYSCAINNQALKMYRNELVYDDGFISTFLKINSKVAYCAGYIWNNLSSVKSKLFPRVGEWIGTKEMVAKFFPEFYDYVTYDETQKPFEKWSEASKNLKVLCDMKYIIVKHEPDKKGVMLYTILIPSYCNGWIDSFKADKHMISATTKNGFFLCKRESLMNVINSLIIFVGKRNEDYKTKKERMISYKDKSLPKNVKYALRHLDKNDDTNYSFSYIDAFYDLLANACYNDKNVKGSELGAIVCINNEPIVTYAALAERWNWSKSKVCRFFKNMKNVCSVYHLTANKGTVIYLNHFISVQSRTKEGTFVEDFIPDQKDVLNMFASDLEKIKSSTVVSITRKFTQSAKNLLRKLGVIPVAEQEAIDADIEAKLKALDGCMPDPRENENFEFEKGLDLFDCAVSRETLIQNNAGLPDEYLDDFGYCPDILITKDNSKIFNKVRNDLLNQEWSFFSKTNWKHFNDATNNL